MWRRGRRISSPPAAHNAELPAFDREDCSAHGDRTRVATPRRVDFRRGTRNAARLARHHECDAWSRMSCHIVRTLFHDLLEQFIWNSETRRIGKRGGREWKDRG